MSLSRSQIQTKSDGKIKPTWWKVTKRQISISLTKTFKRTNYMEEGDSTLTPVAN